MTTGAGMNRRAFLGAIAAGAAVLALPDGASAQQISAASNMPMDENRYRPVRLPARSGGASMTNAQRDELEHHLHCQCGCNLDVYTCRTTDFSCPVSPAMHADVLALVAGGYSAPEIVAAFTSVYGERVLMEPTRSGFNWAAYVVPFAALAGGAGLVTVLLRHWRAEPAVAVAGGPRRLISEDASEDELARIAAAVRDDA